MGVTVWAGAYNDSWQELIVPEAFAHPAKFSRGLIHRIYRHLLEQGYVRPGQTVLDPFGGVALGALDAMTYGLSWVGIELEPRFVALGQQNLALWRRQYGFTSGILLQGDSRQARAVLAGVEAAAVVGSPPFCQSDNRGDRASFDRLQAAVVRDGNGHGGKLGPSIGQGYGTTPGQLGALPPGDLAAIVGSPPYAGAGEGLGTHNGIDYSKAKTGGKACTPARKASGEGYGQSEGQLGALPPGDLAAVVGSPPFCETHASIDKASSQWFDEQIRAGKMRGSTRGNAATAQTGYGSSPSQLGNATSDTFWTAASAIVAECAALLPVGAVAVWVVKDYIKNKQRVPFCDQWRQLCERHGFVLVEEIHASLVEDHGTQGGLFGGSETLTTERKSFFRRLAEKKGSPRIDHETVLILRKETTV